LFRFIEAKNFDQLTTESTAVATALCRCELEHPDRAGRLQIRWTADVFAPSNGESPEMMRRSRNADPFVGDNIRLRMATA